MSKALFWELADSVKRRLFDRLRKETSRIDYLNYKEYREKFEKIPSLLMEEWREIEREIKEKHKDDANTYLHRLRGFLYEALFYYSCLNLEATFIDAELVELGEEKPLFPEYPPWFTAIPLYDIIPSLHHIWEGGVRKRKAPQIKADFLVSFVNDEGPSPPALIDVKSSKPSKYEEEWSWQIPAAMRHGFIFQIAYPRDGVKYPLKLSEWERKTPCSKCKKLSDDYRLCSECKTEIFPFTIVDARYTLKELIKRLGMSYKGRF